MASWQVNATKTKIKWIVLFSFNIDYLQVTIDRDVGIKVSQMATFCWSVDIPHVANNVEESRKTKSFVHFVWVNKR